jgi:hypothetical protein
MLIDQIDGFDPESFERAPGNLLDMIRPTIQACLLPLGAELRSELGGNHHVGTEGRKRFAHEFFVCERALRDRAVAKANSLPPNANLP